MTPPRFDRLAPHYEWIEKLTYGGLLQWCRTAFLGELGPVAWVLVLGEGNGRFLKAFLETNTTAMVDVVEASPAMVELAKRRISILPGALERVNWIIADARRFEPTHEAYDLVVTNFFLDCFPPIVLSSLVECLALGLRPGGRWLVGDFRCPPRGLFRKLASQAVLRLMYAAFTLVTRIPAARLTDPAPSLSACGLEMIAERSRLGGFLSSRLWRRNNRI
jgi:SAM-dependent methyltransferase